MSPDDLTRRIENGAVKKKEGTGQQNESVLGMEETGREMWRRRTNCNERMTQ